MNRQLKALLVLVDQTLDFEEIILLERVENFLNVIPHLGFQLAAAVAERQGKIGLSGFLGLDLLGYDNKSRGDDFVFVADAIADIKILHGDV